MHQSSPTTQLTPPRADAAPPEPPKVLQDVLARADVQINGSRPWDIQVHDKHMYERVFASWSLGLGESYMDGEWDCEQLDELFTRLLRADMGSAALGLARVKLIAEHLRHKLFNLQSKNRAFEVGEQHYDAGNDVFEAMLDSRMIYSCAFWEQADTLEAAQEAKLDMICRKLQLKPGETLLDIGCGWGGLAKFAAERYGVKVTGVTVSKEQLALAQERVRGLPVELLLQDYRDLQGRYDKVVSIEMIEAIGAQYLETYFAKIADLLAPHGRALIQAITIEDHRYQQALGEVDFIKRHIFPGSFIPSIEAMLRAKTRASDLALVHLEDFGLSYARTLQAWRQRFLAHLPEVRDQGFDSRFCRLWEFYLAYCEGGFRERSIGVSHLLLTHPGARGSGERWVQAGV